MKWFTVVFCLASVLLAAVAYSPRLKDDADTVPEIIIPSECAENDICFVKPPEYPTEEINRVAQKMKRRTKRQSADINRLVPVTGDNSNNCAVKTKTAQPYLIQKNDLPQYVIQSAFYKQEVTITSCQNEGVASCFQEFTLPNLSTRCETQFVSSHLMVYNSTTRAANNILVEIPVDCACVIFNNRKYNKYCLNI